MKDFEVDLSGKYLLFRRGYAPEEMRSKIQENGLVGLFVHDIWDRLDSLDFLAECTFWEAPAVTPAYDHSYEFLKRMTKLKSLSIQGGGKKGIDFSSLHMLENLVLNWRKKITGLSGLTALQKLRLTEYSEPNLVPISILSTMASLKLKGSSIKSLDGIQHLPHLKGAYIGSCRNLHSIGELRNARELEELIFWGCPRIESFDALGHLPELRKLDLVDCKNIQSIQFIANFPRLERLFLTGSTNVLDGNMEPAERLKMVVWADRPHYSPRIGDR